MGRNTATLHQHIALLGAQILDEHALILNNDGVLSILSAPDATAYVNGEDITEAVSRGGRACALASHTHARAHTHTYTHRGDSAARRRT